MRSNVDARERRTDQVRRLWAVTFALIGALMAYGLIQYPNAPIQARSGGYFDKWNQRRSIDEYRAFRIWEGTLFGTIGLATAAGITALVSSRVRGR